MIIFKAVAFDEDNDKIFYKFGLKGPHDVNWVDKTDWRADPIWKWQTNSKDVGVNQIRVWVRDGKHNQFPRDDERVIEYIVNEFPKISNVEVSSNFNYRSFYLIIGNENISFSCSAEDPDGYVSQYTWKSRKDGIIGYSNNIYKDMSPLIQYVTVEIKDDSGLSTQSDERILVIINYNILIFFTIIFLIIFIISYFIKFEKPTEPNFTLVRYNKNWLNEFLVDLRNIKFNKIILKRIFIDVMIAIVVTIIVALA